MNSSGTTLDSPETTADDEPVVVPGFAVCIVCSKVFKSKEAISNHIDAMHFDPLGTGLGQKLESRNLSR